MIFLPFNSIVRGFHSYKNFAKVAIFLLVVVLIFNRKTTKGLSLGMEFCIVLVKSELKHSLSVSLQVPHSQCFVDQGSVVALLLRLIVRYLLWDEIPASREKPQHPDLHCVYPVTTSANVKNKPKCCDYWQNGVSSSTNRPTGICPIG